MKFKGTKGKWNVTNAVPNGINKLKGHIEVSSNDWSIACVFNDINGAKANALLISKAPEMLDMLKDVKDYLGSDKREQVEQLIKEATEI